MSGKRFRLRPSSDDERQFTRLRLAPIAETVVRLHRRIEARFPASGLGRVAAELVQLAEQNEDVLHRLIHPYPGCGHRPRLSRIDARGGPDGFERC